MRRDVISFGSTWLHEGTKTLRDVAVDLGLEARPPARPRAIKSRKRLPRTFDRRPKVWIEDVRKMPDETPEGMLKVRRDLSLSRADAARVLRVDRGTVWGWESEYRSAPFSAFLALSLLAEKYSLAEIRRLGSVGVQPPVVPMVLHREPAGRRARAAALHERMLAFSTIYNSGWLVRDSWHGSPARRQECVWRFANVLAREMQRTTDYEALLYAVADTLTAQGSPWEA